jgi:hypothetical protein
MQIALSYFSNMPNPTSVKRIHPVKYVSDSMHNLITNLDTIIVEEASQVQTPHDG